MPGPGVLAGIRVVDFTWVWAGPIIGRHLADYGAEVITIENGDYLDLARQLHYKDGMADPDMAVAFTNYNAGKKSLTLNMAMPEAIGIVKRLLAMSDVLVESMTPRAMRKWGLSYEELRRITPNIIMLSTCMQGQTGPYCMSPGNGAIRGPVYRHVAKRVRHAFHHHGVSGLQRQWPYCYAPGESAARLCTTRGLSLPGGGCLVHHRCAHGV
jgi:crotonobetainyl-CoA:carnitine CoA-transferase CaiB-like acyl-CoA transferase